jgi:hypothetical protein
MSRLLRVNVAIGLMIVVGMFAQARGSLLVPDLSSALWFAGTIFVMTLFDAELPNGDVVDMSTPLVLAATLVVGAPAALASILVSRGLQMVLRREARHAMRAVDALLRSALAVTVVGALANLGLASATDNFASGIGPFALGVAVPVLAFFALAFAAAQVQSSAREVRPLLVLMAGNIRLQGWMIAAQVSVAVLSVLVATRMGPWGLAIVVLLLLVVTQAFTLLVDVRSAYRDTVSLLARAMEAENPERLAHAERVARLASSIGREIGLQGQGLEWLTNAALFHDMDLLGTDDAATTRQLNLEPMVAGPGGAVVGEVKFLEPIARILSIVNAGGETGTSHDEFDIVAAYVVSRASEIDDAANRRLEGACRSDGVGRRLYADRRRDLDSRIARSAARFAADAERSTDARPSDPQ